MAEVIKRRFLTEIARNLYPENAFYNMSISDEGADENESIELPQSAASITSTFGPVNPANTANLANATKLTPIVRINNRATYDIQTFGTNPQALQLSDLGTISYNKRMERFIEHTDVINTDMANYAAIQLAQDAANTDFILPTTSSSTRASKVVGGSSANIKRISKNDMIAVKTRFRRMNLPVGPEGNLFGLVTPEQYEDLLLIPEFVDYDKTSMQSALIPGAVGKLLGFEIMVRHNDALEANVTYGANNAKTAYNAALTGVERSAAIFWHRGFFRTAKGSLKVYDRNNDPEYKADIVSFDNRFGASKKRSDGRGVVSLVETV